MPRASEIRERAEEGTLTMLTAYDATTARVIDEAGIDIILVGDSVGNTQLGYDSTLPVTVEEIRSRAAAVSRATEDVLVVADLPFLSVGVDEAESIENCGRMLKEADADAVKLESGPHTVDLTRRLVELGIPTMAHLGLTPQHERETGLFRQGTDEAGAREILELARRHEEAGAFALVIEHVPANLAGKISEDLTIPTIGIGAGPETDGQILVIDDVLGLSERPAPFAKAFGDVRAEMAAAVDDFREAVESGTFPADEHSHVEEDIDEIY